VDAEATRAVAEVLKLERHRDTLRKQLQEAEAHLQAEVERLAKLGFQRAAPGANDRGDANRPRGGRPNLAPEGFFGTPPAAPPHLERRLAELDQALKGLTDVVQELRQELRFQRRVAPDERPKGYEIPPGTGVPRLAPIKPAQPKPKPLPPDQIN
jgi:hypothetical protein